MRELALVGLVAIVFGLGSYYATDELRRFALANLALGGARAGWPRLALRRAALAAAPALAPRWCRAGCSASRWRSRSRVALERAAARSGMRFDWTFERRYELAPATRAALHELPASSTATLFYDPLDPRVRSTRLLLASLRASRAACRSASGLEDGARGARALRRRRLEHGGARARARASRSSSARSRARSTRRSTGCAPRGRRDRTSCAARARATPERTTELGFGGLAAALATEGYELRSCVTAVAAEVPEDVDAVLVLAPRRRAARRARSPRSSATSSAAARWSRCSSPASRAGSRSCSGAGASRRPTAWSWIPASGEARTATRRASTRSPTTTRPTR